MAYVPPARLWLQPPPLPTLTAFHSLQVIPGPLKTLFIQLGWMNGTQTSSALEQTGVQRLLKARPRQGSLRPTADPFPPPANCCLAHCGPPGLEALRGEGQQESSGNGKFSTNLCGMPERIRVAEKCLDLPLHTGDFSRKEER